MLEIIRCISLVRQVNKTSTKFKLKIVSFDVRIYILRKVIKQQKIDTYYLLL